MKAKVVFSFWLNPSKFGFLSNSKKVKIINGTIMTLNFMLIGQTTISEVIKS